MEVSSVLVIDCFLARAAVDDRIQSGHFCIFLALCHFSAKCSFGEPFNVCRRKLMQVSKLRSTSTYHRRMKELVKLGLISYSPSYNPFTGSTVCFMSASGQLFMLA